MKNKISKKFPIKLSTFLFLSIFICFSVAGCSQEDKQVKLEEPSSPKDINIKTVQAVLEHELTAPDDEYLRLREKTGVISNDLPESDLANIMADYEKVDSYVKEVYEPYSQKMV